MKPRILLLLTPLLLALPTPSRSQIPNWDFALTHDFLSGPPGADLVFAGTITNSTGSDLILNSAGLDFDTVPSSSFFDIDFADEFVNTGLSIPVSGYTGPIFHVLWHADAPIGLSGLGVIEMFADPPGDPESIPLQFTASVVAGTSSSVPEPGDFVWIVAALSAALLVVRRRKHTAL